MDIYSSMINIFSYSFRIERKKERDFQTYLKTKLIQSIDIKFLYFLFNFIMRDRLVHHFTISVIVMIYRTLYSIDFPIYFYIPLKRLIKLCCYYVTNFNIIALKYIMNCTRYATYLTLFLVL